MLQELKKPAGGPDFREGCGGDPSPQRNHENLSQKCQGNYGPVNLLADLLDRHLLLRNEVVLLRAENARLKLLVGRST